MRNYIRNINKNATYQHLCCNQEQPQCFDAADWVTMTIYDNQLQHSTTETLTHHSISNMLKVHLQHILEQKPQLYSE